ncbi:MAG: NAD-dependent deacylase, partial [Pseudomonadota bacterium]
MRSIVILTGAGLSKESGLDTFRDAGGIWSKVRLEDVATPEAYARDPARVQGFYNARRAQLRNPAVQPNAAHDALARLDAAWSGDLLVVTQNIDDLHERAGAKRLLHMHGELLKSRCGACAQIAVAPGDLDDASPCSACGALGRLRPHVVWFGEMPFGMDAIAETIEGCDLFVSIGTSGAVYPAAGFAAAARASGARTLELNLEPTGGPFDDGR